MVNANKGVPYVELMKASDSSVIIAGQKLRVEWIDSFLLIWSEEEHPYRGR